MEQKPVNQDVEQDQVNKPIIGQGLADKKNLKQDQSADTDMETEEDFESDEDFDEDVVEKDRH